LKDVTPAVSTPKDELKFIRTLTGQDAVKKNLFEEDSSSSSSLSVVDATTTLKGDSLTNDEQGEFEETKENTSFVQNVNTATKDALEAKFSSAKYDEINNNSSVSSEPEEKTEVESTTNADNESRTILKSDIVNNNKSLSSDSEEKTEIVGYGVEETRSGKESTRYSFHDNANEASKHSDQFDMNELRDALFKGDAQSLRRVLSQRSMMSQRSHSFASANRNPSVSVRSSSFQHDEITPDDEVLTDDSS